MPREGTMDKTTAQPWDEIERWWVAMAVRFGVGDRIRLKTELADAAWLSEGH